MISEIIMTFRITTSKNQSKNTSTVTPPGGYSSLPGGLSHPEAKSLTNCWTAWRHMHAHQAVSGQNPENAKNQYS